MRCLGSRPCCWVVMKKRLPGPACVAANPDNRPVWHAEHLLHEAAANARLGHLEEAHRLVSQANQVWPGAHGAQPRPGKHHESKRHGPNGTLSRGASSRRATRPRRRRRQLRYEIGRPIAPGRRSRRTHSNHRTGCRDDPHGGPHAPVGGSHADYRRHDGSVFGAVIGGRGWPRGIRLGHQRRRSDARSSSPRNGGTDRRRSHPRHRGGRLEFGTISAVAIWRCGSWPLVIPMSPCNCGGREAWEVAGLPEAPMVPNSLVAGARDNAPTLIRSSGESVEQYHARAAQGNMPKILFSASDDASYVTGAPLVCSIMGMFLHSDRHWPSVIAKFSVSSAVRAWPHPGGIGRLLR